MYTNTDIVTNKMPELKAYVENHNPWIITITEVIPKNYRIPVQKAELTIFNSYEILPKKPHLMQRKRYNYPRTKRPEGTRNQFQNGL